MGEEFLITREMPVSLCDVVLSGQLPPQELSAIVFAPLAWDSFVWDAEDVRETLSPTGKIQEQFIGASDCLARGRNVQLSAWGESDMMKQEDCNEDRANRD
jgi:hypothetical protein